MAAGYRPILVVEDSDEDFEWIHRGLLAVDPQILIVRCDTGEDALDYLFGRHNREWVTPGIVVLDLDLPGVDGFEILSEIQRHQGFLSIPVIVLSATTREHSVQTAYAAGANAFVTKAKSPTDLMRQVAALKTFWYIAAHMPADTG